MPPSMGNSDAQRALFGEGALDRPSKTFRVAVSGDVVLTSLEMEVVDTNAFQRLRRYRQLGTSYLVYPSANHTRFEHSLGVLAKTIQIINHVRQNSHSSEEQKQISARQVRLARLAALLHDIANIPFGHTLEDETRVIVSNQEDRERLQGLLKPEAEIGAVLARQLPPEDQRLLLDILSAKKEPLTGSRVEGVVYLNDLAGDAFIIDIIKNTVCADLLDYLERDTYFCGLPLAVPDRFLMYLYLANEGGVKRLAIRLWKENDLQPRASLISELIQLLETRYFLAERVYFHHAKQISGAMVGAAVWHAMHQSTGSLSLRQLETLGDDELLQHLSDRERYPVASRLARDVLGRRLFKRFFSLDRRKIESDRLHDHLGRLKSLFHEDAANRAEVEDSLCERAGLAAGDVLIYCPDPEMNLKLAEMNVTSRRGGIEQFKSMDDSLAQTKIKSIVESHRNLWALHVFVRPGCMDQHQEEVLRLWCRALFEEVDGSDPHGQRQAIRETLRDIQRRGGQSADIGIEDAIVEEAMAAKRKGPLSRAYLKKRLSVLLEREREEHET